VITDRRASAGSRSAQHGERDGRDVPPAAALRNPVIVSVSDLLGLLAVSFSVLERRVRGVEIVA
jgi:hypothetical protein